MNKHLYRIVFNKARGLLMVVAENVMSACKAPGTTQANPHGPVCVATLTPLRFALLIGLGWVSVVVPAQAQIVADGSAPASQRPTIGVAGNGTPLVDITTPSAAGVSRNTYQQFDVDRRGVILNNGVTNSQTQLGGWVEGNRALANGSARVILNEVNSSNPSQLRGFVEVAGSKAQVVVANPSGIACDGCGFINADRATLTTGRALFQDGQIKGYQVTGGKVSIDGTGMDATQSDYTEIIARTVEVNAGIWSKELSVKAGTSAADPASSEPGAAAVAIDVAQLGGMYAGKITLVGNGAGVGVRNAGQIGASAGEVAISADGRIENRGQISSATRMTVQGDKGIDNSGTLFAKGDLALSTDGDIDNRGIASAQGNVRLTAKGAGSAIRSQAGSALAAGVDSTGKLGSSGSLTLTAAGTLSAQGQNLAAQTLSATAATVDLSDSQTSAQTVNLTGTAGNLDLRRSRVTASQTLTAKASQGLFSDAARVGAAQISLAALDLSNVGGQWVQTGSAGMSVVVGRRLDNSGGTLSSVAGDLLLTSHGEALNNQGGHLEAAKVLNLSAQGLDNREGVVTGGQLLVDTHGRQLDNRQGMLDARDTLTLDSGVLNNDGGTLQALSTMRLDTHGQLLSNRYSGKSGGILGQQAVTLNAGQLLNDEGFIGSGSTLQVGVQQLGNQAGLLRTDGRLSISAASIDNATGGTLLAGQSLVLDSARYSGAGKVLSLGDLAFRLTGDFINSGLFQANGGLSVQTSGRLTNEGTLQAGSLLRLDAGDIDNRASGSLTGLQVQASAGNQFDNRGLIDAQATRLSAATLNNLGRARLYGDHLSIAAGTVNNTAEGGVAATIAARDRLDIATQYLNNREHGLIFSSGNLAIGAALDTADQASGQAQEVNNASATLESLGNLTLDARIIRNTNEHFVIEQAVVSSEVLREFQLSGSPNRYNAGQISTYNDEVQHLVTPEGVKDNWNRYDFTRQVTETRIVSSDPGQMLAGGDIHINAEQLLNDKSRVIAGQTLTANVSSLVNTEVAGQQVTTDSGTLSNFYRIQRKGRDRQGTSTTRYTPAPLIQQISLAPTVFTEHSAINGSGTRIGSLVLADITDKAASTGITPISQVQALTQQDAVGAVEQIRTGGFNPNLPNNSLFHTQPNSTASYLVETDPRFASYRQWLSSDYMLQRLNIDPAATQQRLGDGFYEQKLIREQVAQLTGKRFVDGYASDEEQYRGMIDSAVTLAESWKLIPGVALTAEQMAQLTSDIVWLVSKDVTLASGEVRQVLVPQVYVRVRDGDLEGAGALLAGRQLNLDVRADLVNAGSLSGRDGVTVSTQTLDNLAGRIHGNEVVLTASQDLNNIGGLIGAKSQLALSAGRDLNVLSTTGHSQSDQGTRTALSRVAGLYVSAPAANLIATAGRDIQLQGAQVVNNGAAGKTLLVAGNDLTLSTVSESYTQANRWNADNWRTEASRNEVGSTLQATGDIRLGAGRDLNARAAEVSSMAGVVTASAVRDINLAAGERFDSADEAHKVKGSSGLFSSKTITTRDTLSQTRAQGSTLSGEQTVLQAGRDMSITGSNVVSTSGTLLVAGNDIKVQAATEELDERHFKDVKTSGLFSGGAIAVTIGSQQQTGDNRSRESTAAASSIGATDGNVSIDAAGQYRQVGSHVSAPKGDVSIQAAEVSVLEARNLTSQQQENRFKQSGVTVTVTNPVVSAVQTAQRMKKASERTDDKRMKTLAALSTAFALNDAHTQVMADPASMGGINVSISLGASSNQSKSEQNGSTAAGSTVAAGHDVSIIASGANRSNDLTVQGSQVTAGHDALLKADGNLLLVGAQNTMEQHSTNKGSNASIGIGIAFGGAQNGISFNAAASRSRGNADGNDLVWSNTHVEAGNQVSLVSGKDTDVRGALVAGNTVKADVGGDLNIESLQDTSTFASEQKSMGAGISLCLPPICAGMSSASFSSSNTRQKSNFASVIEQSGIRAGDGGFDITVKGNTDLKGGLIASSEKAIAEGTNRLTTGSLTVADIHNVSEASAKASGVDLDTRMLEGKLGATKALVANSLNNASDSDSKSSDTLSAISAGTLVITNAERQRVLTGLTIDEAIANLNRNTEAAHAAVDRLDVGEMGRKVEAEQEIKRELYRQVALLADEAYRKIFVDKIKVYEVEKDANGTALRDENDKVRYRELSDDEKQHLKPGPDGKVHIANNGIFNDSDGAAKYAEQHSTADTGPQYLIHFEKANNFTSELMIAAYQKMFENDFWGLSTATQQTKDYMAQFGQSGLHVDGHSRGTMTTGNAMESLIRDPASVGILSGTTMNFFGAAYGVEKADNLLGTLQNRDSFSFEAQKDAMVLQYQIHNYDPVGRIPVGLNPGTGGTIPPGSNAVWEVLRVLGGDRTVHNCYGNGGLACRVYWGDSPDFGPHFVKVKQ